MGEFTSFVKALFAIFLIPFPLRAQRAWQNPQPAGNSFYSVMIPDAKKNGLQGKQE
jgi:hypothetical protein